MAVETAVPVELATVRLDADLVVPDRATGLVLFAHGSGSSRHSPRNREVADRLHRAGLGTVLADLLTREEQYRDEFDAQLRFDIDRLGDRMTGLVDWASRDPTLARLPLGLFGASTGAAAALVAAAARPDEVRAVVSRGGRPDLAGDALPLVRAPTLLLVGEQDRVVLSLNQQAAARLGGDCELRAVPRAGHLFEEPGTLAEVARYATEWFRRHLSADGDGSGGGDGSRGGDGFAGGRAG